MSIGRGAVSSGARVFGAEDGMNYTIDEQGIHFATDDMPIEDGLKTIRKVAAQYAVPECECAQIGIRPCGMCGDGLTATLDDAPRGDPATAAQ